jgi:hypothetical protein
MLHVLGHEITRPRIQIVSCPLCPHEIAAKWHGNAIAKKTKHTIADSAGFRNNSSDGRLCKEQLKVQLKVRVVALEHPSAPDGGYAHLPLHVGMRDTRLAREAAANQPRPPTMAS